MAKVTHIVLHYSATYADQNITAADIDKMHKERGWKGIGYHWFIRRDGTVEEGRPESQVGAHVGGQNTGKIGICCAGGLDHATGPNKGADNRTRAQISAQIELIRNCLKRYPGAKVVGHRDLAPTQCPGFDVQAWWAQVQKKKQPTPAPVKPDAPVVTPNVSENGFHHVEKGETWFSISQMYGMRLADLLSLNGSTEADVLKTGRVLRLKPQKAVPVIPSSEPTGLAALIALIKKWIGL